MIVFLIVFIIVFADINMLGILRRMFVGIQFAKDPSERIVVVILRWAWNACLAAGISERR